MEIGVQTVYISIRKLIVQLLTQMGMLYATPVATPMIPDHRFTKEDQPDLKIIKVDKQYKKIQKK
jgi:hypothetical protein